MKKMSISAFTKTALGAFLILFMGAFAQGCLSDSNPSSSSEGILTGKLTQAIGNILVAVKDDQRIEIPVNSDGSFQAQLTPGRYALLMKTLDGKITLIKQSLSIENNLTFTVLNADLIPIPQAISVNVPLVYKDSVIIEWETNIEADGRVDYGKNELYGFSSYTDSELKIKHRVQLFNLQAGTTYHFRIVSSRYSLESTQSMSKDFEFTTEN